MSYTCAECGIEIEIGTEKPCGHTDAPIIADMTAVATGEGSAE